MFLDKLNWRYATKKMDPSKPVSEENVAKIVEAIRMAPSSSGTQPYNVFVVSNPEVRAQLSEAAFGQQQLVDGSHVIVFAAWDNYTEERISSIVDVHVDVRGGERKPVNDYYDGLRGKLLPRDPEVNFEHAARQAYIGLGFGLAAAAELGVDTTPMEGFIPEKVDEILGLAELGLKSAVILTIGTRDAENDWLLPQKKVRRSVESFVTKID
ncbi:nitroreductase [Pacificibacter maritimus]|uniref:Nitroreductase n=1 Tax=Pacificibacter maritimus TaxID=762213 RepID=A0A3N4U9F4_9RHOB|nr:NAD(P)H-dependent oxidoreductase [Pacificibacter maritimus]RPE67363.1 nitroreductase [Pacificibacter maritimus]